jgi:diacylglycerol kinase family enzyme
VPSLTEEIERLTLSSTPDPSRPAKRMLVIVNPYAATVSDRLRNLVVYALGGRYEVEAIDTQARGHATELCREAAEDGYDVVVAFGGDGTVNEAVNGLAGSRTPLTCLPGGSTNVYCRVLGIPGEIVDATEHLLGMADRWAPRSVDLGTVNGRHFAFSAGVGLDASVVRRVDAHMHLKARLGPYYFTYAAVGTFVRRYLVRAPRLLVTDGAHGGAGATEALPGVTAVVQNAAPYTYFQSRRIDVAEGATLNGGTLSAAVLGRASPLDMPTLLWRVFSRRARVASHRQITTLEGLHELQVRSADERPLPLQVDGDFIGEVDQAHFRAWPGALTVVS